MTCYLEITSITSPHLNICTSVVALNYAKNVSPVSESFVQNITYQRRLHWRGGRRRGIEWFVDTYKRFCPSLCSLVHQVNACMCFFFFHGLFYVVLIILLLSLYSHIFTVISTACYFLYRYFADEELPYIFCCFSIL